MAGEAYNGLHMLTGDPKLVERYKAEVAGKTANEVQALIDDIEASMNTALAEMGDEMDLGKATSLSGADADQRGESWVKLQSQRAGYGAAHSEKTQLEIARADIHDTAEAQARRETNGGVSAQTVSELEARVDQLLASQQVGPMGRRYASQGTMTQALQTHIGNDVNLEEWLSEDHAVFDLSAEASEPFVRNVLPHIYGATVDTTDVPPFSVREPGYVPIAYRPVQLRMFVPTIGTDQNAIKYLEQNVRTPATDMNVAENEALPESQIGATDRTVNIEDVGTYIPMSNRVLDDVAEARYMLDMDLPAMVEERIDEQIGTGSGSGNQWRGFLNTTGIQSIDTPNYDLSLSAFVGDGADDAKKKNDGSAKLWKMILEAKLINLKKTARANANIIVLMPEMIVNLLTGETQSAGFYAGSPQNAWTMMAMGLPIVPYEPGLALPTQAGAANKKVVGWIQDTAWSRLRIRQGIRIEVGFINDDLIKRQRTYACYMRGCTYLTRPAALCQFEATAVA